MHFSWTRCRKRVYLIRFAPPAFVPHRRIRSSRAPFVGPFLLISFVDVSLQKRQLSKRKVTPQVVPQGLQECNLLQKRALLRKRVLPLPLEYPRPLPVPRPAVSPASRSVYRSISPRTCKPGYERFKPNNRGHHLGRGYYRGGWHPFGSQTALSNKAKPSNSYPPLIPRAC